VHGHVTRWGGLIGVSCEGPCEEGTSPGDPASQSSGLLLPSK